MNAKHPADAGAATLTTRPFHSSPELRARDWEVALAIRLIVFVTEQHCPIEEERDAYDEVASHWLILLGDVAIGTARVIATPEGWKIGRVAVLQEHRGCGAGLGIMQAILDDADAKGVGQDLPGLPGVRHPLLRAPGLRGRGPGLPGRAHPAPADVRVV